MYIYAQSYNMAVYYIYWSVYSPARHAPWFSYIVEIIEDTLKDNTEYAESNQNQKSFLVSFCHPRGLGVYCINM